MAKHKRIRSIKQDNMSKLLLHSQEILVYEKGVFIMPKCKVIAVTNQKGGVGKLQLQRMWPLVWLEMDAMY